MIIEFSKGCEGDAMKDWRNDSELAGDREASLSNEVWAEIWVELLATANS